MRRSSARRPITNQPMEGGFYTVLGVIDPGDHRFFRGLLKMFIMEEVIIRGLIFIVHGRAGTSMFSRGATLTVRWLYEPQQSAISGWGGASTPCGAASTPEITVFVPGFMELWIYERTSDPGMEPYPARVWRDLDVRPTGSSPRDRILVFSCFFFNTWRCHSPVIYFGKKTYKHVSCEFDKFRVDAPICKPREISDFANTIEEFN